MAKKQPPETPFLNLDERNVVDKYKQLTNEEIRADLKQTALPAAVLMLQILGDFNISTIIRNVNFFNLSRLYYHGIKRYDRRGTVGTHHYSEVVYLPNIDDILDLKSQYWFVGLENNIEDRPVTLGQYHWRPNSLLVIGEEGIGVPRHILNLCNDLVEIPNRGSVRSLNAGTAAGIAMFHYVEDMKEKWR